MLNTTIKEMRPSSSNRANGRARLLQTAILALACAAVATPSLARSAARNAFDGDWSVLIMTRNGPCDPSLRYGVQISNGQVVNNGAAAVDIQGRVNPNGTVRVNVQAGGQWASGAGRLDLARGGGLWQGQGSAGACSGTWIAPKRRCRRGGTGRANSPSARRPDLQLRAAARSDDASAGGAKPKCRCLLCSTFPDLQSGVRNLYGQRRHAPSVPLTDFNG